MNAPILPNRSRGAQARSPTSLWVGLSAAALTACISLEATTPIEPMCQTNADCDLGETCDVEICWGDPPDRRFGAILLPPAEGPADLAPTHIGELQISDDGSIGNLIFAETVTITGRVVSDCGEAPAPDCDPSASIAARISFSRPSPIPGQPAYTRTVLGQAGVEDGEPSFTVTLPRSEVVEYQVAVVPTDAATGGSSPSSPAAWAPPSQRVITADRNMTVEWHLGSPNTTSELYGRVVNILEQGIPDMQIFALPQGADPSADERISSIIRTDENGGFYLRVPRELATQFDLIAVSLLDEEAPMLRARGRAFTDPAAPEPEDIGDLVMPAYGAPQWYTVPVRGVNLNGDNVPIAGATVHMTTELPEAGPNTAPFYSTIGFSDDKGDARMRLIPGNGMENRVYTVYIEPLDGSEHTTVHRKLLDVGATEGYLEEVHLDRRIAVAGQIVTHDDTPAAETTLQAKLAPGFRASLEGQDRQRLDGLLLPSALTDQSGGFVIWLDQFLADESAVYDLSLAPSDPLMPHWTAKSVAMDDINEYNTVELGAIALPSASYARGPVADLSGAAVAGAQVRLFEIRTDTTCEDPEVPCRSVFRGLHNADDSGSVMLVLPE